MPHEKALTLEAILETLVAKPGTKDSGYELLFDTLLQTSTEGTRTSVVSARQLLFRIGTVFVDVEVGREANSDRASLIGQMLDSSNPGHPPAGIRVTLLNRGRNIASTSSNDNGEFQFQFPMKNNLKLAVAVNRDHPVYLPITGPSKTGADSSAAKQTNSRGLASVAVA